MNYFLLVLSAVIWLASTLVFIIKDATFDYAVSAIIFNIYVAAIIVVSAIKENK